MRTMRRFILPSLLGLQPEAQEKLQQLSQCPLGQHARPGHAFSGPLDRWNLLASSREGAAPDAMA